jgi:mono/diheme cytochrome c family protein
VTDERTGRELTPRDDRTGVHRAPSSIDRFDAGDRAHTVGLTEERAAQVVRQSGNARNIAFLAVLLIVLFVPIYWFYDIGVPVIQGSSRLETEKERQYVTDVARGYSLFIANCAQCHGPDGQGGVGPPLNDQAKLYNALTATGLPGTGHLNPDYIERVLTYGGRYVCGDPNSVMPAWLEPNGPLNYRQIEELIAFLTASKETTFVPPVEQHGESDVHAEPSPMTGWRDPAYSPAPDEPTPPACWRDPDGITIGANASPGAGGGGGGTVDNPGTADQPRDVSVQETADLRITDPDGQQLPAITVKAGETVRFVVENTAGFEHNFKLGTAEELEQASADADLPGTPVFTEGTQEYVWEVPSDATGLQYACTVPGHYPSMHGDFQIVE